MILSYKRYKKQLDRLFRQQNVQYLINSTGQFVADCPFCKGKKKFYFDPKTTMWQCFHEARTGNAITLVSELLNINHKFAIDYLKKGEEKQRVGLQIEYQDLVIKDIQEEKQNNIEYISLPRKFRKFTCEISDILKYQRFYIYLLKRGINSYMISYFDIRYDPYAERIVFPIYFNQRPVGYQSRAIYDYIEPKALTKPKNFSKSLVLYNYDKVQHETFITLVEGPVDACKCVEYNPICLLGKTLSDEQIELLRQMRNLKTIFIALDPEEHGAKNLLNKKLSSYWECRNVVFEPGTDAGDKTQTEIKKYMESSRKFSNLEIFQKELKKNH